MLYNRLGVTVVKKMQAIITQLQELGTWSPWKPIMLIWCEFYWLKKWVRSRSKNTKAYNDGKER